jgi:hypothetical protein
VSAVGSTASATAVRQAFTAEASMTAPIRPLSAAMSAFYTASKAD